MDEDINNELLTSLISGLEYDALKEEYIFKNNRYKLRDIKRSDKKIPKTHLYFININEPADLRLVKAIKSLPTYDGFNDVLIDKNLRKAIYQQEYYKRVTLEKRHKASEQSKIERAKIKAIKEEQKAKEKEIEKQRKQEQIKSIKCKFCDKEFIPKNKVQKFCCHTCQLKYNSKKQAKQIKENNKSEKICPICKKSFIGNPRDIYCSKICYKISQKENRKLRYERNKALKQINTADNHTDLTNIENK